MNESAVLLSISAFTGRCRGSLFVLKYKYSPGTAFCAVKGPGPRAAAGGAAHRCSARCTGRITARLTAGGIVKWGDGNEKIV